jgi:ATP-dependent helicase/nuclease subunit A
MPDLILPPDQAARDRITEDLDTTLFVEAGAGSGKTSALVDRVLALVTGGEAELRSIAAITFTEKASADLRDRI